jgi:hypothetical protein
VTVLRPPRWQRLVGSVAIASLAALLVAGEIEEGGWFLGVCLVGASAVVAVAVRNWLLRVVVGDELTVVNWSRTLHIPWSEVERFGYDSGLWLRRRSGRQHSIAAFAAVTGALPGVDRRGREAAVRLEAERRRRA